MLAAWRFPNAPRRPLLVYCRAELDKRITKSSASRVLGTLRGRLAKVSVGCSLLIDREFSGEPSGSRAFPVPLNGRHRPVIVLI